MLRITQVRSVIGRPPRHRRIVRALGLRRIRHSVVHEDRPEIRGMIAKIPHLVEVEEVDGGVVTPAGPGAALGGTERDVAPESATGGKRAVETAEQPQTTDSDTDAKTDVETDA